MGAIEVQGLRKRFGEVLAVDDLTFAVPTGRVTGFLGPNGAGKTTTLRMILGLVGPDAGYATIEGTRLAELSDPARVVGAVLGTEQFHPHRKGRDHLGFLAAASGIEKDRIDDVLALVELAHAAGRRVGGYSLGMRQRLGLASALLGDPKILVLDEPANGLDPAGIRWLRDFLRSFVATGRTAFVSSHLLAEMSEIADDVIVIDRGRMLLHAPMNELLGRTSDRVRVTTTKPEKLADLLASRGIEVERMSSEVLNVSASPRVVGELAATEGIAIIGLDHEQRSLEDVFFELTADEERSA